MSGKRPNLDKVFLVDTTGPIGNRISDGSSNNRRDENRPERRLAKADKTANSDKHHGAWRKQADDRQGFAGRYEKGCRNCQIRMEPSEINEVLKVPRHDCPSASDPALATALCDASTSPGGSRHVCQ